MSIPKQRSNTPCIAGSLALACTAFACGPEPVVSIEPSAELVTSEAGKSVDIVVSLKEAPRGTVTVRATSSDASEGRVSGPLQFDSGNWTKPQRITITGVDDSIDDGDATYEVTFEAVTSRYVQQAFVIETLSFVNRDDEVARFIGLGDLPGGDIASYARDVSDSGEVIVGWSRNDAGDEAIRWTPTSGLIGLGGVESQAHAVSPDGQLIVGSVAEPTYESGHAAAIWRVGAAPEVFPPYVIPDGPPLFYPVDGTVVRNAGDLFGACIQYHAYGNRLMCHISASGELSAGGIGEVFAADDAGDTVGVTYPDPRSAAIGSRATQNGLLSYELEYPAGSICIQPHRCGSEARAFSTNPAVIVGTSRVPAVGQASTGGAALFNVGFMATESEGMLRLADLAEGEESSGAYAIDASGRVIGGFGANADGQRAVVWVDRVPRLLSDIVAQAGGSVPAGWILREVRAMSTDGLSFVGNATNPDGNPEAFVIVLPSPL
jgi:uncharacterized membrane protein